jgi:hypothetical protein
VALQVLQVEVRPNTMAMSNGTDGREIAPDRIQRINDEQEVMVDSQQLLGMAAVFVRTLRYVI